MLYVKNLPLWERMLRVGGALAMAIYALLHFGSAISWIILASAAGIALSGIFGFCPACALVGRRLDKHKG